MACEVFISSGRRSPLGFMDVDVGDRAITISEGCTGEGLEDPKTDLLKSWPSGLSRL